MEFRTAAVVSCWISIAIIAAVYMMLFAESIGDVMFRIFLPIGLLVFVALGVTLYLESKN